MRLALILLSSAVAVWAQTDSIQPSTAHLYQAQVTAAEGKVSIDRDNRPWAISTGDKVGTQRTVTTGQDGYASFYVSGGSTFDIYANSRLIFRENPGRAGDLIDVMSGRVRVHLSPGVSEPEQRIFCRTAIITARDPATVAIATDEDGNVRIDVLEGEIAVQHALLPRSAPTIVKAIDAIVVQKDEQISRRVERGSLYRYTIKPLKDLLTFGHSGSKVQEQEPFMSGEVVAESFLPRN